MSIFLFHVCMELLSALRTRLQMCFTMLQLFIPSLARYGDLLFVLAFKPILLLGLSGGYRRDPKVLLTHYFVVYGLIET